LIVGDLVRNFVSRVGLAGIILIASLVIFAFLAGGVVVHRLETTPTAAGQQEEKQGEQAAENDQGESKSKKASQGRGNSQDPSEAADTEND